MHAPSLPSSAPAGSPSVRPAVSPAPERRVGSYVLERRLGAGGMGEVWLAHHAVTGGVAAVKLLRDSARARLSTRLLFASERRAIARLAHPHVVPLFEIGDDHLATAYVDGGDLARKLRAALEPHEAVRIAVQIASALAHAHALGIVHRDVKPGNVLLDRRGNAFLADFGLAVCESDEGAVPAGTPAFMAPEQVTSAKVGPAADQYALARTLAQMLIGADAPLERDALLRELPASLPPELRAAIARATAEDPSERWPSIHAFAAALEACNLHGLPAPYRLLPPRRPAPPFAWAAHPERTAEPAPHIARAEYRLSSLAGVIPEGVLDQFRRASGIEDTGFSVYGHTGRLGPLTSPDAFARASEVIVLLHGWATTREVWDPMAVALCRNNSEALVLAPDVHGFGECRFVGDAPTSAQLSPRGLAETTRHWLAMLGLRDLPLVLAGHSMAACALLTLTDAELGLRTTRVLLTPMVPQALRGWQAKTYSMAATIRATRMFPSLYRALLLRSLETAPTTAGLALHIKAKVVEEALRVNPEIHAKIAVGCAGYTPAPPPELRRVRIVLGANDPEATPERAARTKDVLGLDRGQVAWVATGYHHPHVESEEHPEWTAQNQDELVRIIDAALVEARDQTQTSTELARTELAAGNEAASGVRSREAPETPRKAG